MKTTIYLILVTFLFSCADRNYINPVEMRSDELTGACPLYLKTQDLCLSMRWSKLPTESEVGAFEIRLYRKEDPTTTISPSSDLHVVLWMPSMNHGSSPVTTREIFPGVWEARDVFFIMAGPWDIRYQLRQDGRVLEQVIQKIFI